MAVQSIAVILAFWWTYLNPPTWANQLHEDRIAIETSVAELKVVTDRLERINVTAEAKAEGGAAIVITPEEGTFHRLFVAELKNQIEASYGDRLHPTTGGN